MTRSVQIVERMRWMSALAGAAVVTLAVCTVLAITSGQLGSSSASAATAPGSSAPLDPRIATLAHHHPNRTVQTIVQFNAPVSVAKAQADVHAHGRIIGNLPIIHATPNSMSSPIADLILVGEST